MSADRKGQVALYTSAWIEIACNACARRTRLVALYTSAWIEIDGYLDDVTKEQVALYTSAWIEINTELRRKRRKTRSHSTRVRGLKCDH